MAESEIAVDQPSRQPRVIADEAQMRGDGEAPTVEIIEEPPTPEGALADLHKALAEKDKVIKSKDGVINDLSQGKTRVERELQRAAVVRVNDRRVAVSEAISSATSEKNQAVAAKRAAREAGDIEAELKADEALQAASFRLHSANAELASLPKEGDPASAAGRVTDPGAQGNGVSPQAQAWIDAHPRFNSDKGYRDAMLASHAALLRDGVMEGSPAYFRGLDETAAVLDGTGNGGGGRMGEGGGNGNGKGQPFGGAPPARGGGGGGGGGSGGRTVNVRVGPDRLVPVTISRRSDGSIAKIHVPPGDRADLEEGAKICGMALGDYIVDMVENGDKGLIHTEGQSYR